MQCWLCDPMAIYASYDASRVQEVGPERACAEWLLRCGAAIRWQTAGPGTFTKDYNALPATLSRDVKIVEIDATDSAIMELGFPHFYGLTELKRIKFKNCRSDRPSAIWQGRRPFTILCFFPQVHDEQVDRHPQRHWRAETRGAGGRVHGQLLSHFSLAFHSPFTRP